MDRDTLTKLIISPDFGGQVLILKIALMVFSLVLLIGLIVFFRKTSWWKFFILADIAEFLTFRPYGIKNIEKIWDKIKARLETGLESEHKLAVIEADSLLDDTLSRMGYAGESLGERLTKISSLILPSTEEIRLTHQIRNNIIHDPDYKLSLDEAKKAMVVYEKALTDLQVL